MMGLMSDQEITKIIANNLSRLRKEFHYTQKEAAEKADLNMNYYAKVERGEAMPSLKTIKKLTRAFKVTSTDIIGF